MSGIYEALRQKREEISGSTPRTSARIAALSSNSGVEDLGELSEALQAMVSAALDEDPGQDSLPRREVSRARSLFEATPGKEFRPLRLAAPANPALLFRNNPDGVAAEQFRFLRRRLEQKFPGGAGLLITSPAPKDGKSLTALNLSACLAQTGRPTLLVEADIRQPSLSAMVADTKDMAGIEGAFAGVSEPQQVVHSLEELSIYVALVGNPPNDPSRLLGSASTKSFLSWAREKFHWVVIDAPPVLPAVDVSLLAGLADATLLVLRSHQTPRGLAIRAIELLGSHLSGVIMNDASIQSKSYGYLQYGSRKADAANTTSSDEPIALQM